MQERHQSVLQVSLLGDLQACRNRFRDAGAVLGHFRSAFDVLEMDKAVFPVCQDRIQQPKLAGVSVGSGGSL